MKTKLKQPMKGTPSALGTSALGTSALGTSRPMQTSALGTSALEMTSAPEMTSAVEMTSALETSAVEMTSALEMAIALEMTNAVEMTSALGKAHWNSTTLSELGGSQPENLPACKSVDVAHQSAWQSVAQDFVNYPGSGGYRAICFV